jgi:hypothetical protein
MEGAQTSVTNSGPAGIQAAMRTDAERLQDRLRPQLAEEKCQENYERQKNSLMGLVWRLGKEFLRRAGVGLLLG